MKKGDHPAGPKTSLQPGHLEPEVNKEDLRSTNEELTVANQALLSLNEAVTAERDFAEAIITTVREPLLVLDKDLRVKIANNHFYKAFKVDAAETIGKLIYDLGNKQWNIPRLRRLLEKVLPQKESFVDVEVTHTFQGIGRRTMLLNARQIARKAGMEKLILLAIEDVTNRREAEKILRKTEARFRQLAQGLPAAVYSCDARGEITFYNQAAEKLWGRKPVAGKDFWCGAYKIFNPDGSPLPRERYPLAMAVNEGYATVGTELIIERPDGTRSFVEANPQLEMGLSCEITGAVNTLADVTEIKKAERMLRESEARFRQMADLMPVKVCTSDASGDFTYYNQNWLDYTGLDLEDLKGWGWKSLVHADDLDETVRLWQQSLDTGKDFEFELRFRNKSGAYQWHLCRCFAVKGDDGRIETWISSSTEIQDLKEESEELERVVKTRTQELLEKNLGLAKMNQELEAFTYITSHDLQEPLRKIQTFALRIFEKERQNLTESGKVDLQRMEGAANRMQQLLKDLLSFSLVNSADRSFERVDLQEVLDEVKKEFTQSILEKNAVVEAAELGSASIIRHQFFQLLYNLIGNSLKFSHPETPPHIIVESRTVSGGALNLENPGLLPSHASVPEQNFFHLTVRDNGIGFEPKFRDKIFEVFQRLHGKETYAGTGIGLAIAKKIVENHNGSITAASELGKGARFDVYWPVL